MKITFVNEVLNVSKSLEFDPKKIAEKYLDENKEDQTAVINDLSFGGYYSEDLTFYIEALLNEYAENDYTYDFEDYVNLRAAVKDCIIH
jgi:UDP-glucose 6-dehydrogenase